MTDTLSPRRMLDRLVAFPTIPTRSNLDLISFVESFLGDLGVASHRVPDATGEKASLFARIGPEVPGGVVLSGHSDVVPVIGQAWSTDPFRLTERDGRLYGRGTCDMKGFCATALAMVPEMLAADLKRPIFLALSYDEEVGCLGAPDMIDALIAREPRPGAVIVGEPTEMRVVTGHKSGWGYRVDVRGHSVHSSLMHRGVSAVMEAARLIAWMGHQVEENAKGAAGLADGFDPPYTTLHAGRIAGGTADNITARDCWFSGEVRAVPSEPLSDWQARVRAEAARIETRMKAIHPEAAIEISTHMDLPGCQPEPDGVAERLARALTGDNGRHVVSYMTEAGQFQERGLSTVVCGPGSISQAHQPDEFIAISELDAGARFMRRLIETLAA
jgi:acetylornithine deacetylase